MRALVVAGGGWRWQDLPAPVPGHGEALVQVRAVALNRADLDERRGTYRGKRPDPAGRNIAGAELAGVVTGLGPGVTGVDLGDRVMAMVDGAFADQVAVDERLLLPVPDTVDWPQAAALPVACLTEYDALVTQGGFVGGQSVLVLGATSGVGSFATALARQLGAGVVVGTSRSAAKLARAAFLDAGVDTTREDLAAVVEAHTGGAGADVVLDHVGGDLVDRAVAATRIGGTVVQIGRLGGDLAHLDLDQLAYRRVRLVGTTFRTRDADEQAAVVAAVREHVLPALAEGALTIHVDSQFAFDAVEEAHAYLATGATHGKVVLAVEV